MVDAAEEAVHGFRTLPGHLATLTGNTLATKGDSPVAFTAYATPTAVRKKAFQRPGVKHIPWPALAVTAQTFRRMPKKIKGP